MNPDKDWQGLSSIARSLNIELHASKYRDHLPDATENLTNRQSSLASVWF